MDRIVKLPDLDRRDLFMRTSEIMRVQPAIIEKDFWVCWILAILFRSPQWRDKMVFKGGTSLSKVFGIIDRFSEDIDLILDWKQLGIAEDEPWKYRTNTGQDKYCKKLNEAASKYIDCTFIPLFAAELERQLGRKVPIASEKGIVTIQYPRAFPTDYIRPEVLLEIGPLAEWVPHAPFEITSYAADEFPDFFTKKSAKVFAILAERTFWEKVTILHQQAMAGKISKRYSRHYYDLAQMAHHPVKERALSKIDLLEEVVTFKKRFYRSPKARYDLAVPGTVRLLPSAELFPELSRDYKQMKEMIFGEPPGFDSIITTLKDLEYEINQLKG